MSDEPVVAGIDCGTNSLRLLIARVRVGGLEEVVRLTRIVRLGESVAATGRVSPQALERAFAVAEEFAALIREHGVRATRFVATSATRDASNIEDFLDGMHARLGVTPMVIDGAREARLSFSGAVTGLAGAGLVGPDDRLLVVDLGGGSTELVRGRGDDLAGESVALCSSQLGSVRMTELFGARFGWGDPPSPGEVGQAHRVVDGLLDDGFARVAVDGVTVLVGVAGTVTTLTALALGLESYDGSRVDGAELSSEQMLGACARVLGASQAELGATGIIPAGREDVIGAGALIWRRLVERVVDGAGGPVRLLTSRRDILDGVAALAAHDL